MAFCRRRDGHQPQRNAFTSLILAKASVAERFKISAARLQYPPEVLEDLLFTLPVASKMTVRVWNLPPLKL
jgi:hypothetical protein